MSSGPSGAEARRFHPDASAVVVVDAQNDFCHPEGQQARLGRDVGKVAPALTRLEAFLGAARAALVPVIFLQTTHSPRTDTPEWLARHAGPPREQSCQEGSWGAELSLPVLGGDHVVEKHRYSGFVDTRLEELLRELGRSSVHYTGFVTGTCVETTLRDGVCLDLLGTLVEDCCGSYTERAHVRAVESVAEAFGAVVTGAEAVARWDESQRRRAPGPGTSASAPGGPCA